MQRVKNIEYNEDDLYSEEEDDYAEEDHEYSAEDKDNFATLTPVVRAELDEAGLQASDREIADALWHYYWDVGKSAAYLKNSRTPRQTQQPAQKKGKAKSKFDQAAEKSAEKAGECYISFATTGAMDYVDLHSWTTKKRIIDRRGGFSIFVRHASHVTDNWFRRLHTSTTSKLV